MFREPLARAATALVAVVLLGACAGSSTPSTTSGGAAGSSNGGYFDSGSQTCVNSYCLKDADCCSGFACNTVDQIDTCCELASSGVQCELDTDCCPISVDGGGSSLPFCNNGQCIPAPNCAGLQTPCNLLPCCPGPLGTVICSPLNGTCVYASGTTGTTTGGSSTGGSTSTSGGSGTGTGGSSGFDGGPETSWVFSWTYGLNQACEQAGVAWVEIQLNGNTIGLFPCRDPSGVEGATIPAPPLTQASYTISGYNAAGSLVLAQASGATPYADGPTSVPIDLSFNDGGPSDLVLSWTFGGQSCAQAGVTQVQVTLVDPNEPALDVNGPAACSPAGVQGVTLQGYGHGQYPLTLSASGSDGGYQAGGSISANGLSDSVAQVDLLPSSDQTSGDVLVKFDFGGEGCLAAGLDSVGLQLSTIRGTALAPAVVLGCDAGASYTFSGVPAPATGFLWVEGIAQGQVQQLSNLQVIVSPGGTATYSVVTQLGN